MALSNLLQKNRTFLFTISFILTSLITTVLITSNQVNLTNNESSIEGFDTQIPKESYVYYEDTTGFAYGVYVSGDYAYVAAATSGLVVINISDPTNPGAPIYEVTTGFSMDVYVSGDYAYVADGWGFGLAIIDISDPKDPEAPVYEATGAAYGVYVSGDYAYVAAYTSGLAVINISDPTNPGAPVYMNTDGTANGVYVSGDYAYVADGSKGLAVIDISDPKDPGAPVYSEDTDGYANDVYVSGDYAYVADSVPGLAVINISDPKDPGAPVYEDTTGVANDVYVSGDYAYVADDINGLAVINISDPTNPGTPVYEDTTGTANGVYVSGDYAYMADYSGFAVIDISVPINPGMPFYEDTTGAANDVYVSGDYAYVADYTSGLTVIDISDPTNPGTPVNESTPGYAYGVYVSGDYAYVADGSKGLTVINISDPTNPGTPVNEDTTGTANGVYVSGDYAYVADDINGLAVINISDPTDPGTPIYQNTDGVAYDVYVSGDYAYVADFLGLAVIDISDPTKPIKPIYYESTSGYASGVYVSGDYAYLANWESGLAIIDISDPTNPGTPVYYEDTTGAAGDVYVSGDYAYVADYGGLAVINISDPTNPGAPVYMNTTGTAYGVYVNGDYAYVADWGSGLAVIQIRKRADMVDPIIINAPSDLTVESGYIGKNISWTATDSNPDTYTVELQGIGTVAGPTTWISGVEITYNIPNGLAVGVYVYMVNFTDNNGNSINNSATVTVNDTTKPTIISASSDLTVESGYIGQSISWTVTDPNPDTYTIDLQGVGVVAGPIAWISGLNITYDIPDGFAVGVYVYMINLTDDYGNFINNSITITVNDTTNPTIISAPSNLAVELGYTGRSISWTATDPNPDTYAIELQGVEIVATTWISGVVITYNIPNGFTTGVYVYTVNFTDDYGNSINDSVTFTVGDTTNPTIISAPSDLTVELGYTEQSLSWTATDLNPNTYTIELQGSGIVAGPTAWSSGLTMTYDIPDGFAVGVYVYTVNFTDDYGNSINDSVIFTIEDAGTGDGEVAIPGASFEITLIISISTIASIIIMKKKKHQYL